MEKNKKMTNQTLLVSIVIATTNRKEDLKKCLKSLMHATYKNEEIILIDNASDPPVSAGFLKGFKKIKLLRSGKNLGAAGGRNLGIKHAKGDFILFMDDDAVADKGMIKELLKVLQSEKAVGIVHPKIYDLEKKDVLQGLGCDVNLLTGRVSAAGIREKDSGQYDKIRELQTVGCIWMVKRALIDKIGGYDEEYFIPWEDTDFSFRAKRAGFKILFVPKALAWHRGKKSTFVHPLLDYIGIRSVDRAYRISRNKMIFMRKFSPFPKNLFFFFLLMPLYTVIHSVIIAWVGRIDILLKYWQGVLSGYWYSLSYPLRQKTLKYKYDK